MEKNWDLAYSGLETLSWKRIPGVAIYIPWFDSRSADTITELSGTWRPLQVTNLQLLPQIVFNFFQKSTFLSILIMCITNIIEKILLFIISLLFLNASINLGLALFSLARTIYDIWFYQNLIKALTDYGFIQANITSVWLVWQRPHSSPSLKF